MSIFYNGSFCPVHEGHLDAATAALKHVRQLHSKREDDAQANVSVCVYMSPSHSMYVRRKGDGVYVPLRHRLDLLQKAIEEHKKMSGEGDGDSIVIDTNECFKSRHMPLKQIMREFELSHPNEPLYWLQGVDVANAPPPGWTSLVVVNRQTTTATNSASDRSGKSTRKKASTRSTVGAANNTSENIIVIQRPHLNLCSSSIRDGNVCSTICTELMKRRGLWTTASNAQENVVTNSDCPSVPEEYDNMNDLEYIHTHSNNLLFAGAEKDIFIKKCEAASPEPELYGSSLIGGRLEGLIPQLLGKTGSTLCLKHAGDPTNHAKGWDVSQWQSVVEQLAIFHAEFWDAVPALVASIDALDTDKLVRGLKGRLRKNKGLLDQIQEHLGRAQQDLRGGFVTVVHGDVWCGNVAFAGNGRPVFLDLETLGKGHPLVDLAFAMIDSVDPANRREVDIKVLYHATLVRHTGIWIPFDRLFAAWKAAKTFACAKSLAGGLFVGGDLKHRLLLKLFD